MAKSKRIRQAKKQEEADLFGCIETSIVGKEPTHAEDRFQSEYKWSSMNLPSPPPFNCHNFDIWSSKMRVYLRYVNTHVDVNDEVRDSLALHLIQQALDKSILHKVASTKTSKEAWSILEEEVSERGSSYNGAYEAVKIEVEKMVNDFVGKADHDQIEDSESHNAVKHVDVVEVDEEVASPAILEDEATIAVIEKEIATQEVVGQPLKVATAAQVDEEELLESIPMRAKDFLNNVFVYECAGTRRDQLATEKIEEHKAHANYDKEILFAKEMQNLEDEMKLIADLWNGRKVEFENLVEESSIEVAKIVEKVNVEGNQETAICKTKFVDDGHREMPILLSSNITVEADPDMEEYENENLEKDTAESIFMKWSPEEIRYYYELMWQQATERVAENMKAKDSLWDFDIPTEQQLKSMLKLEFEDEHA